MVQRVFVIVCALSLCVSLVSCATPTTKEARFLSRGTQYLSEGKYAEAAIEFKNVLQINPKNAKAHLQLAHAYLKLGGIPNLRLAYAELVKTSDLDPNLMEAQIRLAELYLLSGETAKAKERAQRSLQGTPDPLVQVEAHLVLSRVFFQEKDLAAAEAELKKVLGIDPKRLATYYDLSALYLAKKENGLAEESLKKALEQDPKSVETRLAYARYYQLVGQGEQAEASFRQAINLDPTRKSLYPVLARYLLERGQVEKAEAELLRLTQIDPKDPGPYLLLGDFYSDRRRVADAEQSYLRAITADPKAVPPQAKLTEFYLKQGKKEEAGRYIEGILSKNPGNLTGLLLKGELLLVERKVKEALPIFQKVAKEDATLPQPHYYLGVAHQAEGDETQAKAELAKAIELSPTYFDARLALAQLHLRSKSYNLAIEETGAVLKAQPQNVQALLLMGDAYLGKGDLPKGKEIFQEVVSRSPDTGTAHVRLGMIEASRRNEKSAKEHFEKALALNPHAVDALIQLTGVYTRAKETETAIKRVQDQIALSPKNPVYYNLLGRLYQMKKDPASAEKAYLKSVDVDPNALLSYVDLGRLYVSQKQYQHAVDQFESARKVNPNYLPAYMMIGIIYEEQHQTEKARAEYEKALKIDPTFGPAANNLAWIYSESGGNIDQALSLAQTAKERLPEDPGVSDTLGWIYFKKNAYLKAISHLKESVEKIPTNPISHYHLGMAYLMNGERDLAKKELTQAISIDPHFSGADQAKEALKKL